VSRLTIAATRRLRAIPFWLLFVVSLSGYAALRIWFPLRPNLLAAPARDLNALAPSPWQGLVYAALVTALFGAYWSALMRVRCRPRAPRARLVLLAAAAYCLPLLTAFPINATDLFRYAIRGRVASIYGASPFSTPPAVFAADPFLPLAGEWAGETSPYGPLWEGLAAGVTAAAPTDLWTNLLAFKVLMAAAHLATGIVLWRLVRRQSADARRSIAVLLAWTWNPALLLTFVMDGHNDALMLFWLVLGFGLMASGRRVVGVLVAALGALTKPIGVLALPFMFLAGWSELREWRQRRRFLALAGGGVVVLAGLVFLPFGSPLSLAARLLREAGEVAGFSPATLLVLVLTRLGADGALETVGFAGTILFAAALLLLLWFSGRGRPVRRGMADAFLVYVWQALAFRIWYAVWPFPWLLLDDDREARVRRRAGHLFLYTAQLSVVVYGHLYRVALGGDHLWSHALGVPLVFIAPWLAAWISVRRAQRPKAIQTLL
jgi:hypothetical protein